MEQKLQLIARRDVAGKEGLLAAGIGYAWDASTGPAGITRSTFDAEFRSFYAGLLGFENRNITPFSWRRSMDYAHTPDIWGGLNFPSINIDFSIAWENASSIYRHMESTISTLRLGSLNMTEVYNGFSNFSTGIIDLPSNGVNGVTYWVRGGNGYFPSGYDVRVNGNNHATPNGKSIQLNGSSAQIDVNLNMDYAREEEKGFQREIARNPGDTRSIQRIHDQNLRIQRQGVLNEKISVIKRQRYEIKRQYLRIWFIHLWLIKRRIR